MNAIMCVMSECVQCHRDTLTLASNPIVICHDCLRDRQPMSYQVRLPKPPLPRWKSWPPHIAVLVLWLWFLSWLLDADWTFWALNLPIHLLLLLRGSRRIRARAARRRSELQSARNEALRKRVGGWDAQ